MSDVIRHSIHCHGYRGCDVGFDDDACTCGATLKHCQAEIERLRAELSQRKDTQRANEESFIDEMVRHTQTMQDRDAALAEITRLREWKLDVEAALARVMAEQCAPDEQLQQQLEKFEELRAEIERLRLAWDSEIQIGVHWKRERDEAREAVRGMSTFLTNEELAWACDTWPWLGEVEDE